MNRLTRFGLPFLFSWGLNACGTTASSEDVAVAPEPEVIEPVEETAVPEQADEAAEEPDVEVVSNMDEAPLITRLRNRRTTSKPKKCQLKRAR